MKSSGYKTISHIYVIFFILLIGTLTAGIGMGLYTITVQKPDGQTGLSSWPIEFTEDFSGYIVWADDQPQIKQSGLELLKKNGLWAQIINTNGDEVQSFDKPKEIPAHYSPSVLLDLYQNGTVNFTVFSGNIHLAATNGHIS